MKKGKFVISLDFELHWGNPEKWDLNERKDCLNETRKSIPMVLDLFKKYEIHATWATVGILFAKNKSQLLKNLPSKKTSKLLHLCLQVLFAFCSYAGDRMGEGRIIDRWACAFS